MTDDTDPFEVSVNMTRGTSTDDRDKIKATIAADSLDELDDKMVEMRDRLEKLAADVRKIQPDESDAGLDDDQAKLGVEADD
jgi:hypothetical protein